MIILSFIYHLPKLIISHDIVTVEPILTLYVVPLLLKRGRREVTLIPLTGGKFCAEVNFAAIGEGMAPGF